jgi:hypothetical protein
MLAPVPDDLISPQKSPPFDSSHPLGYLSEMAGD